MNIAVLTDFLVDLENKGVSVQQNISSYGGENLIKFTLSVEKSLSSDALIAFYIPRSDKISFSYDSGGNVQNISEDSFVKVATNWSKPKTLFTVGEIKNHAENIGTVYFKIKIGDMVSTYSECEDYQITGVLSNFPDTTLISGYIDEDLDLIVMLGITEVPKDVFEN